MKLSEQTDNLTKRLADIIKQDVTAVTTKPQAAHHSRELPAGCYMLRVHIVANADLPPELGTITLYPTISKAQIKRDPDSVLASVLRYISTAAQYRAGMIARAKERVTA